MIHIFFKDLAVWGFLVVFVKCFFVLVFIFCYQKKVVLTLVEDVGLSSRLSASVNLEGNSTCI